MLMAGYVRCEDAFLNLTFIAKRHSQKYCKQIQNTASSASCSRLTLVRSIK